jgi:hypothetical protein
MASSNVEELLHQLAVERELLTESKSVPIEQRQNRSLQLLNIIYCLSAMLLHLNFDIALERPIANKSRAGHNDIVCAL